MLDGDRLAVVEDPHLTGVGDEVALGILLAIDLAGEIGQGTTYFHDNCFREVTDADGILVRLHPTGPTGVGLLGCNLGAPCLGEGASYWSGVCLISISRDAR